MKPLSRRLVVVALVVGAGVALAAVPPARERGFRPTVRLADPAGDARLATARLADGLATMRLVLHGLSADDPTRAYFRKLLDELESFDLVSLHESLPQVEGDWRAVRFTGRAERGGPEQGRYRLERVEAYALDPDGPVGGAFGDLGLSFRSRPAKVAKEGAEPEANGNFVGNLKLGIGLGEGSWAGLVAWVAEWARLLESTGPGAPAVPPERRPSPASLERVGKDNPKCGPEDREFMGLFLESYPHLYEHLVTLYRTDDVVVFDPETEGYQQLHLVMGVRRDAAKNRAVIEWLERLGPLMSGRVDLANEAGETLMTVRFTSKDLQVTVDAFVANGKLCPVEGGKVMVDRGVDLETVLASKHRDTWSFDMDVNGIATEIRDLAFRVDYAHDPKTGAKVRMALDVEPRVRVHGSAFGVIPTWAIDILMPGNMEELTRSFLRVMTRGNDGQGFVVDLGTRRGAKGSTLLELDATGEALNNFLIRLGFKIARRKLIPPDDAVEQLAAYLREGQDALAKDVAAYAEGLGK